MPTDTASLVDRSARLDLAGIDFDHFARRPLDADSLRCLRYMHDVEGHTSCYLRDVLATRAHRQPEVTAFLACWAYEEHWHGEAIARILDAHGEVAGGARLWALRRRLPRADAFRPALFAVGSALLTDLTAVHMTWGAVNEWTTQAGYARLAAKAQHPVLSDLLRRIMRQEGRHIDFYVTEARRLLGAGRAPQRLTRAALRRFWGPVGSSVMPPGEVAFVVAHLFGDHDGRRAARRIDANVDRLPGLAGLHLVEAAADQATARRAA